MPPPSPSERVAEVSGGREPGWARLVLTGAARGWIIFAIVWGSVLYLGQIGIQSALRSSGTTTVDQYNTVVSDFNATGTAVQRAGQDAARCSTVSCLRSSHLAAADSFSSMADDVGGMSLPANASGPADRVQSEAHRLSTIFTDLANSSDATTYVATTKRSNLSSVLNSYAANTQSLLNALRSNF